MRIKLTEDFIKSGLRCPTGRRRCEFVDISDAVGLYVQVVANRKGEGVYYYRYRAPATSKTRHARIGKTGEVSLEEARRKAKQLRAQVTLGVDPQDVVEPDQVVRAPGQVPLLKDFFWGRYLDFAKTRKRGWNKERQIFALRLEREFGHLRLDQITLEQAQSFHTGLLKKSNLAPATANHTVKLLRHVLNVAVSWDLIEKNPVARIALAKENNAIERYMNEDELARLLMVLRTDPARNACNVALLLLATGVRLNEALTAAWENVEIENRLWRIPAANSKSGTVRSVPLNEAALEVLEKLPTLGKSQWLFVNPRGERLKYIHACWNRLRRKAGLPHLRLHDLRHQYASFLVNSGRTLYEVQAILGHSDPVVTQRYAHLSTKALQDASDSAADAINGALKQSA